MDKIILTTTPSFSNALLRSELKDFLSKRGLDVILQESLFPPFPFDPSSIWGMVAGAAVPVGRKELEGFPNLRVIAPFGVGLDHIDCAAAEELGIKVQNMPGVNRDAVAELTIAFIFALARNIVRYTYDMHSGVWKRLHGNEVAGKVLGIVGLGNIGKEVAKKARALGMRVLANDIVYDESFLDSYGIEKADFETVLRESDYLTLHVPLTEATERMLNAQTFSLMKQGVRVINTSRGPVVDEEALLGAIESGQVMGAALDVLTMEPPLKDPFKDPIIGRLIMRPEVLVTPHVASFTPETHYKVARRICEEMIPFLLASV